MVVVAREVEVQKKRPQIAAPYHSENTCSSTIHSPIVTIQHILQWSATLGLIHFHEIWILALKKQGQCVSGGHALLAAS